MYGVIKYVSKRDDYCFITGDDSNDYFLHIRDTP